MKKYFIILPDTDDTDNSFFKLDMSLLLVRNVPEKMIIDRFRGLIIKKLSYCLYLRNELVDDFFKKELSDLGMGYSRKIFSGTSCSLKREVYGTYWIAKYREKNMLGTF